MAITLLLLFALLAAACGDDDGDASDDESTPETASDTTSADGATTTAASSEGASGDAASGEPIIVGVAQDLTGPVGSYGTEMVRGAELAVEQFNAEGGLDGRPVELVVEDLASDRALMASAIQKLAGEGAVAIHGPTASSAVPVGSPVVAEEGIVMIPPGSQEAFDDTVLNDWIFRVVGVTEAILPDVLAQMQSASPFTRVAIFYDPANNASVDDARLIEENAESAGYEVVASETAEAGATDFSSQVSNISSAEPDAIWMSHLVEENAAFMIQARERGIDAQFIGGSTFTDPDIFEIAGDAGEGALTYVPFLPSSPDPETQAFVSAFTEFAGEEPTAFTADGFDAMWGILHGLREAGSADRVALRDAMGSLSFEGATGTITWDGAGDNQTPGFTVVRVEDGVFVPLED